MYSNNIQPPRHIKCRNSNGDFKDYRTKLQKFDDWSVKNAAPKNYKQCESNCSLVQYRFAKQEPMTRKQWKTFKEWVAQRALPKRNLDIMLDNYPSRKNSPSGQQPSKARLSLLSLPKQRKEKFISKNEELKFEPNLNRRRVPENLIRQPIEYKVSKCFQHPDIESKFWREFKFPISPNALTYQPGERILKLSEPRKQTSEQYCDYVNKIGVRQTMTRSEWNEHQRKLKLLANPNLRNKPEENIVPRGKRVPLNKLQPRINSLSVPLKLYRYDDYVNDDKITKQTQKSNSSPKKFKKWLNKLATPKQYIEKPVKDEGVNKSALKAHASKRVKCLARPKFYIETPEEKVKKIDKLQNYVSQILMGSSYHRCMREKPQIKKKLKLKSKKISQSKLVDESGDSIHINRRRTTK